MLKKKLLHRCFPVNSMKFLRTPFLTEHLRWLLLAVAVVDNASDVWGTASLVVSRNKTLVDSIDEVVETLPIRQFLRT